MSYTYEIEIDVPVYVSPDLVAQKAREVIERILERYGVFLFEIEVKAGSREREEIVEEEA